MNWSAGKIGTIYQRSAHANGSSTPPIGCVLHLVGLPGGGSKIYDRSPYGNIGTITGATWRRSPSGLWLLDFDGSDDYVDCGNGAALAITEQLTMLVWLYRTGKVTNQHIIMKAKTADNPCYGLFWEWYSEKIALALDVGGYAIRGFTVALALNTWHFVAVTYDGSFAKIYSEGNLDDSSSLSGSIASISDANVILGSGVQTQWGNNWYEGYMALPRIYNRALSALEIQNSFNREKHLFGVW